MNTIKNEIIDYFRNQLIRDEKSRKYEKEISKFAYSYSSDDGITAFKELMEDGGEFAYEAFFCLATIHRHNRDFTELWKLISEAEQKSELCNHVSFSHIKIMYETHSESLYDYDTLLNAAHQSACNLFDNSGYHHTFANAFATICEKCLPGDLETIVDTWYDSALYCVNKAIELEPDYAKYYCTKARILSFKHHYEEASELILKAIDKENSKKSDYALLIGNYQYFRILIAMRKQKWLMDKQLGNVSPEHKKDKKEAPSNYQKLRPYVFISYSHNDEQSVFEILNDMSNLDINYWYDKELVTGSEWPEILGERIMNCEMVMVMLSNSAVLSRNVRNEITMALNHNKKVLPVLIEDVVLSPGTKLQLQSSHWLQRFKMSSDLFRQKLCQELSNVRNIPIEKANKVSSKSPNLILQDNEISLNIPNFGIIEQFCASKTTSPKDSEDAIVINEKFIAVIDGATSKTNNKFRGRTGGRIAADLIASYLQGGTIDSNMDYKTATYRIQAELQEYAYKNNLEEKGVHLCASAAIFSISKKQIWVIGDCQFLLNGKQYAFHKKVDTILSDARSLAIHMLIQSGLTEEELMKKDRARNLILGELKMQQFLENKDDEYGYGVFSSQGNVKNIYVENVPPGSEVVLASDGYPELYPTLAESEARLNELIRLDPLCYKMYKSTKGLMKNCTHFDDRSYIRFRVS